MSAPAAAGAGAALDAAGAEAGRQLSARAPLAVGLTWAGVHSCSEGGAGGSREFSWFVGNGKGILGSLDGNGVVTFAIEAGDNSPVRGTAMFAKMMAFFGRGVKAIQGNWTYGDNLAEVNRLTGVGVPLRDAVKQTWTARRAMDHGFTRATVNAAEGKPGAYTKVQATFSSSDSGDGN